MRAGDKGRLNVIRMLKAAIQRREVDERIELNDAGVLKAVEKLVSFFENTSPVNVDFFRDMFLLTNGYATLNSKTIKLISFNSNSVSSAEVALPNDIGTDEEVLNAMNNQSSHSEDTPARKKQASSSTQPVSHKEIAQKNTPEDNIIEESDEDQSIEVLEGAVNSIISSFF